MTDRPAPAATGRNADNTPRGRFRLCLPRRSVIAGMIVGASFTFGYLVNSFFYCRAQFSCAISPFWLVALAVIGVAVGALWGWSVGKFIRFMYRVTRVD